MKDSWIHGFIVVVIVLIFGVLFYIGVTTPNEEYKPKYYKYELSNGNIVCCVNALFYHQGAATLDNCQDNRTYQNQVNVIDYNERC